MASRRGAVVARVPGVDGDVVAAVVTRGHCAECDGLQEDGECLEGGPFGCSRAEKARAWERAYAAGLASLVAT